MSASALWARLIGGPCDGQVMWVEPECWAVVATRDSDRQGWNREIVVSEDQELVWVATEAHLYTRLSDKRFGHTPLGLARSYPAGQPVWTLQRSEPT